MAVTAQRGWVELPLNCLQKARWNYKQDDRRMLARLKANIRRNGQVENIIVRAVGAMPSGETLYEIVNGNHRYDAMVELGIPTVMCYSVGEMSLAGAKRLAIETNETKFDMDKALFGETLVELVDAFGMEDLQESMPLYEKEMAEAVAEFDVAAAEALLAGKATVKSARSVGDAAFGGAGEGSSPLPTREGGSVGLAVGGGEDGGLRGASDVGVDENEEENEEEKDVDSWGEQTQRVGGGVEASGSGDVRWKKLVFVVPESVYDAFFEWVARLERVTGKRDENRAFEFAVVEALNTPEDSLR